METLKLPLFKKDLNIFPISSEKPIYIRGVCLRIMTERADNEYGENTEIDINLFNELLSKETANTNILNRYKSKKLTYGDLDLIHDIVFKDNKNLKIDQLDINKQAQYISRNFKCICSVSQLLEYRNNKNNIKTRLKTISKLK